MGYFTLFMYAIHSYGCDNEHSIPTISHGFTGCPHQNNGFTGCPHQNDGFTGPKTLLVINLCDPESVSV